jgi:glycosyltransferase involved in cell wall biosynthesis
MKNNKLAIAIPTYNRAAILRENILLMLGEIRRFSIPVYISDDSTNNETEIVFQEIKKVYEYIYYYKNSPSLGHDKNCLRTIGLPSEDYVWYLGDSNIIKPFGIEKILNIINNNDFDFVSVNVSTRELDLSDKLITDGNQLLFDLGWHLTMTSATIYSKRIHNK